MSIPPPEVVVNQLSTLGMGMVGLGRMHALQHLCEACMETKLDCAFRFFGSLENASNVDDFLRRFLQTSLPVIYWPRNLNPQRIGILTERQVSVHQLHEKIKRLERAVETLAGSILNQSTNSPYAQPLQWLLKGAVRNRPVDQETEAQWDELAEGEPPGEVHKAVCGPAHVKLDPAFTPDFSLLDRNVPSYGENAEKVSPYLWCLSIRETLVSELCALTSIEYDGLPLAFYRDMAKQCWDEIRHAIAYFRRSTALIPTAFDQMTSDAPFRAGMERYLATGTGLPVPRECNLYETVVNADIVERLVLVNIQVETPAIARLKEKIGSPFSSNDPELKRLFEYDKLDETFHSDIGIKWLK